MGIIVIRLKNFLVAMRRTLVRALAATTKGFLDIDLLRCTNLSNLIKINSHNIYILKIAYDS